MRWILIVLFCFKILTDPVQPLVRNGRCLQSTLAFTPQELTRIAKRVPDKWERVALATGYFKNYELANIRLNQSYHDDVSKAIQMLSDYGKRRGTREKLAEALKEFEEIDLAEKVMLRYFQVYAN